MKYNYTHYTHNCIWLFDIVIFWGCRENCFSSLGVVQVIFIIILWSYASHLDLVYLYLFWVIWMNSSEDEIAEWTFLPKAKHNPKERNTGEINTNEEIACNYCVGSHATLLINFEIQAYILLERVLRRVRVVMPSFTILMKRVLLVVSFIANLMMPTSFNWLIGKPLTGWNNEGFTWRWLLV